MAVDNHAVNTTQTHNLTGKIKWLDAQGIGYILPDIPSFPEVYVSPSSLSSDIIQEGDCVKFNAKFNGSNPPHSMEATDVVPFGIKCSFCKRFGHFSGSCPERAVSKVKCFRCGLIGHYAKNCDQKFHRWFFNQTRRRTRAHNGRWSSLFDGAGTHIGGVGMMVCVKKKADVKKVEEVEDCFILEFDPTELDKFSNLSLCDQSHVVADEDDVSILAEKGKVACRDYPHPRHLCATHPFKKTPHELHCKMCYCYICDVPAPCRKWNEGSKDHSLSHCHAAANSPFWKTLRDQEKRRT